MSKKLKALVLEVPKPRDPFAVLARKRSAGAHSSRKRQADKQRREMQRELADGRKTQRDGSTSTSASGKLWSMLNPGRLRSVRYATATW